MFLDDRSREARSRDVRLGFRLSGDPGLGHQEIRILGT